MSIDLEGDDLNKFILVGDRVLIKPKSTKNQIRLYLPPGVKKMRKFTVVMLSKLVLVILYQIWLRLMNHG